jgi:hypothetical protein
MASAIPSASVRGTNTATPDDSVVLICRDINLYSFYPYHTIIVSSEIVLASHRALEKVQKMRHRKTAVFEDSNIILRGHKWLTW